MEPTKILSDEHRVIEVVLDVLERMTEQARKEKKLDAESAGQAIDFIRNFADKCHHGKEEDHLFTTLVDKGMPRDGGPVGQMLIEHDQGRAFVAGMDESTTKAAEGETAAIAKFAENARGYVELLRAHIQKEDGVLFPMADRFLSDDEQKTLLDTFNKVESEHMGEGTHEKYLDLARSLAERYGVSTDSIKDHSCGCGHH